MLLDDLNEPQKQAVSHIKGPLLILAGPGSGKTRVITHRIAYLIEQGVPSWEILAMTFTNKAAGVMKERVKNLVHGNCYSFISTFHSFCAYILRQHCEILGYQKDFTIYDTDDQKRALKHVLDILNIDVGANVNNTLSRISYYKNKGMEPQDIPSQHNIWSKQYIRIYTEYQKYLFQNNALDFDDLLLKTVELFTNYKDVLKIYQEKYKYILVDEYQDTNILQYKIIKFLGEKHKNVCVTGDPDQSIYSWRGANIGNILSFENDFPETLVVKLETNYRSTGHILKAASHVIKHNQLRKDKELWSIKELGNLIRVVEVPEEMDEAIFIAQEISRWKYNYKLRDIVIFYRMNAQSRYLESALRTRHIPYIVVGGLAFYQRAEIKDILAYLRIIINEKDDVSLTRILNVPPRKIGKKALETIYAMARKYNSSLMEVMQKDETLSLLSRQASHQIHIFLDMIESIRNMTDTSLVERVTTLLKTSGYADYIEKQDQKKDEDRMENIKELLISIQEYEKVTKSNDLSIYLQNISLMESTDKENAKEEDYVTLMTLHSAKGLEFPVVYIVGGVEGVLPHQRSLDAEGFEELEEERRLFFVGMTRAKERLTITYPKETMRYSYNWTGGNMHSNDPSRFLDELPISSIEKISYNTYNRERFY
ncbi:MAG TPA: 3'-5' exonuclease [Planctomycetota bacterium]|nr:3'-5' exonuclease [Planctomycetota bacterium]